MAKIFGLHVYAAIHESIASGVRLFKDAIDGYLYQGDIVGKVSVGNDSDSGYFILQISKELMLSYKTAKQTTHHILVTNRYSGDRIDDLLQTDAITVDFGAVKDLSALFDTSKNIAQLPEAIFSSDRDFKFIGIGELYLNKPKWSFSKPPWEMVEEGNSCFREENK